MDERSRWVTWARAAVVAAPFLVLAALPGLSRSTTGPPVAVATVAVEQPAPRPAPMLTLARRWPREHTITQDHPLTLYWGCGDGPGGCRFTTGKLVAEILSSTPLDLRADNLGLDTFLVSAPAGYTLRAIAADGVDCRPIAGEPHGILCVLTRSSASLTFVTSP